MQTKPNNTNEFTITNSYTNEKIEDTQNLAKIELKQLQEDILKNISLKLWLINLLLEEKVHEEQFNRMYKQYEAEYISFMNIYNKMVMNARNLAPLKISLN